MRTQASQKCDLHKHVVKVKKLALTHRRNRTPNYNSSLSLLGKSLANEESALLLQQHNVESIEVRCLPLGLLRLPPLGPCALSPLFCHSRFVEEFLDC